MNNKSRIVNVRAFSNLELILNEFTHLNNINFNDTISGVSGDISSEYFIKMLEANLNNATKTDYNLDGSPIKPIDIELIEKYKDTNILVFQDVNGLYEAICEVFNLNVKKVGVGNEFYKNYGTVHDAREYFGLSINLIHEKVMNELI